MKFYLWKEKLWKKTHYVISLKKTRSGENESMEVAVKNEEEIEGYFAEHHEYCDCFGLREIPEGLEEAYQTIIGARKLLDDEQERDGGED